MEVAEISLNDQSPTWGQNFSNATGSFAKKCQHIALVIIGPPLLVMSLHNPTNNLLKGLLSFTAESCIANPLALASLITGFRSGVPLTTLAARAGLISCSTAAAIGFGVPGLAEANRKHSAPLKMATWVAMVAGVMALPAYWLMKSR